MKLGQECLISTLPSHIFPVDIALGVQEIKKGNNVTTNDDEVQTYEILLGTGPLTKNEEQNLHPDIKKSLFKLYNEEVCGSYCNKRADREHEKGKYYSYKL